MGGVGYFIEGSWSNSEPAPSHFIGIKSDKQLIINRCDFTAIVDSGLGIPIQKFTIESSINGKHWNTLYTGSIPKSSEYAWLPYSCEFNPTRCKYIRCTFSSTAYEVYSFWGKSFKFYGALSINQDPFLYTNPDAYGIRKKEK